MGAEQHGSSKENETLTKQDSSTTLSSRNSLGSNSSASSTSLLRKGLDNVPRPNGTDARHKLAHNFNYQDDDDDDVEAPTFSHSSKNGARGRAKRIKWLFYLVSLLGWIFAIVLFFAKGQSKQPPTPVETPSASTSNPGNGQSEQSPTPSTVSENLITLDQVLGGQWSARHHEISWIAGANGEDGLLLEQGQSGKDYLVVEDVRRRKDDSKGLASTTLMRNSTFQVGQENVYPDKVWPSPDLKSVLVMSKRQKNWRHSFTGLYWIFDVATQKGQPLDPLDPDGRIQLASWAPTSDAIVFTRQNNMYLRILSSTAIRQITSDGGEQLFYGVPDWVYEEEVFQGNSATWWDKEGNYIAYLRTNESLVPEYPVQYFLSRPSGAKPLPGEDAYPEVRQIRYPKAGASNPTVDVEFYDIARAESFSVTISGGFTDDDRLIIEVLWASSGHVLVRETNRESDTVRLVLIDVTTRTGKVVRTQDVADLDGGWVEPTSTTRFVPADPNNGRPYDGYIDTVPHKNNDHLAYFSPLDSSTPVMLTSGDWEVVDAPSAVDLKNNLVYFIATKEAPTQRHVYSIRLDGSELKPLVPADQPAYYSASFSKGAGYSLLTYSGPDIPSQKVISTPSNDDVYDEILEENTALSHMVSTHEMAQEIYSTVTVDNFTLQVVERRPFHFDEKKRYPVLFYLYGGPGSQSVSRKFGVDFQSYVVSSLGYIVVTVDGRGTGFNGRKARCIIRGDIGHYESRDQIETAKMWSKKSYVDETRLAIWGWSYGGFMALKTLEQDAGQTFRYGMAVAPVTDWRFYDSIYTERYMHTPQHNPSGYDSSAINNMRALQQNVRFLVMHGVADDNVHMQSTLTLIDKLDMAGVENYDMHMFPDSDHSIYFHNANRMVYDKLSNWLVNAFNGEWLKTDHPNPIKMKRKKAVVT